jgi:hypothetical protein
MLVPSRVDDDDVAGADLRRRALEVLAGDDLPFSFEIDTTTPVPKKEASGTSSMKRAPSIT